MPFAVVSALSSHQTPFWTTFEDHSPHRCRGQYVIRESVRKKVSCTGNWAGRRGEIVYMGLNAELTPRYCVYGFGTGTNQALFKRRGKVYRRTKSEARWIRGLRSADGGWRPTLIDTKRPSY